MQENNPTPKRRTLVRLLAFLAALIVLAGSIFCIVGTGGPTALDETAWNLPGFGRASAEEAFKPLRKGSSGAQVKEMQQALWALGYYEGPLDGNFSKALEAAVLSFQADFELDETGKIDLETYELLLPEVPAPGSGDEASPSPTPESAPFVVRGEWYSDRDHVAAYLREFGELPDNYLTKKEAQALGWVSSEGNLWQVAPGKSIGGDFFGNYEGLLPKKNGRKYYECDIDFDGGYRNGKRIIFSNDGLIFYTDNHYESFKEIKE